MTTPSEPAADAGLFDAVVNLCKRRGFVFPSAEIYGGIRSTYDYGPLGALMLRNVREAWWRAMVQERDDVVPHRRRHPHEPEGLGGVRPSRHLHRPARRLPQLQGALAGRPDRRHLPELRLVRSRPRRGRSTSCSRPSSAPWRTDRCRIPAPRDRTGDVRQLLERLRRRCGASRRSASPRSAGPSETRSRPATSCSVRAEFEMMEMEFFVPPADSPTLVRVLVRRASRLVPALRDSPRAAAPAPARAGGALALLLGHGRRRVPLPVGLGRARGNRQPDRLRPARPPGALRSLARALRPGDR